MEKQGEDSSDSKHLVVLIRRQVLLLTYQADIVRCDHSLW